MLLPPAGGVGAASVQLVPAAPQVGQQGRVLLRHLPPPLIECTSHSPTVKDSLNQHYSTTERANLSASSPHLARRVRLPTCSDTPSRALYIVQCACLLVPCIMCVGIYSHTYKHTIMYTLYYTSIPSHSFSSLSCPVTHQ